MERDYFPLLPGLVLAYRTKSLEGQGRLKIEVLSLEAAGGLLRAKCRRTSALAGRVKVSEFEVVQDERGVHADGGLDLPLPPDVGRRWSRGAASYAVEADDAVTTVPAGTYRGCLRVAYRLAGGDAGGGERFYAPGVGLVRELCTDETDPFELALERVVPPK